MARARGQRLECAGGRSSVREDAGEAAMAARRHEREEEERCVGEESRTPPPRWLIRAAGGGEWDHRVAAELLWPGVACGHRKANRRRATKDPGVGNRRVDRGVVACSYVRSCASGGPGLIDCTWRNRKRCGTSQEVGK